MTWGEQSKCQPGSYWERAYKYDPVYSGWPSYFFLAADQDSQNVEPAVLKKVKINGALPNYPDWLEKPIYEFL